MDIVHNAKIYCITHRTVDDIRGILKTCPALPKRSEEIRRVVGQSLEAALKLKQTRAITDVDHPDGDTVLVTMNVCGEHVFGILRENTQGADYSLVTVVSRAKAEVRYETGRWSDWGSPTTAAPKVTTSLGPKIAAALTTSPSIDTAVAMAVAQSDAEREAPKAVRVPRQEAAIADEPLAPFDEEPDDDDDVVPQYVPVVERIEYVKELIRAEPSITSKGRGGINEKLVAKFGIGMGHTSIMAIRAQVEKEPKAAPLRAQVAANAPPLTGLEKALAFERQCIAEERRLAERLDKIRAERDALLADHATAAHAVSHARQETEELLRAARGE